MALKKEDSQLSDRNDFPLIGEAQTAITSLTDSTTGTASDTLDDTTAGQKDDVASLAAKINSILTVLRNHGLIKS